MYLSSGPSHNNNLINRLTLTKNHYHVASLPTSSRWTNTARTPCGDGAFDKVSMGRRLDCVWDEGYYHRYERPQTHKICSFPLPLSRHQSKQSSLTINPHRILRTASLRPGHSHHQRSNRHSPQRRRPPELPRDLVRSPDRVVERHHGRCAQQRLRDLLPALAPGPSGRRASAGSARLQVAVVQRRSHYSRQQYPGRHDRG